VLLYQAFGWDMPCFAHQSLILGPDGKKYSKRHGAVAVTEYREMGILSDALFNALLRLGWSHGDQEIFSRAEAVALFDIKDARRAPAIFDTEKLKSTFNHHYLRAGDAGLVRRLLSEQLAGLGLAVEADDPRLGLLVAPLSDRARTVREMAEQARVLLAPEVAFEEKAQKKHLTPAAATVLEEVASRLEALPADPTDGDIMACFTGVAEAHGLGMGKVAQPARVAMLGTDRSPGIELVVRVVGIARAAARMRAAAAGARG
jgi:glutamyl-tRNA synthetase